jgi:hypothetical protein
MSRLPGPTEATTGRGLSPRALSNLLSYGSDSTLKSIVSQVLEERDGRLLSLLARTLLSDEPVMLRIRCLEILGLAAADSSKEDALRILATLTDLCHDRS